MKARSLAFFWFLVIVMVTASCGGAESTPTPVQESIVFFAENENLPTGSCTFLRWDVSGGFGVTLDGTDVSKSGESEVCPGETHIYKLAVDMGDRVEHREILITVEPGASIEPTEQVETGNEPGPLEPGTPAYEAGTWVATGGPPGGLGYDIRMDPRNPDVMYVTDAWAGAFKSLDGGATWFPINNGITTRTGQSGDAIPVFSLSIDPNHPDTLWAGTQFGGSIFRSDDAGESWRSMSNGIIENRLTIRGITVEPGNSDVVYLAGEISSWEWNTYPINSFGLDATKGVVYKTTDGGQNWKRIWLGDNLTRYIWIHPDNHNLIYVSTGIFDRAAANGDAAKYCLSNSSVDGCVYNPELDQEQAAALNPGGAGILRSKDGGQTWEELKENNGFRKNELYFGSLFMHPENPQILLAAAGNGVYPISPGHPLGAIYLTEKGGDTWERVLELVNASVVEICTSDPSVMYAGSINGIYRSDDGGHTWLETAKQLWGSDDVLAGFPIDMQCDPRNPKRIFINNYIGGNFLSTDGGVTWVVSSKGYTGALLRQVAVAMDDSNHVYSATRMGIFTSSDAGNNWVGTAYFPARAPEGTVVAVDPFDGNHIMTVLQDAGPEPKVSNDGGKSWDVVQTGFWGPGKWESGEFSRIVFSQFEPGLVLATAGSVDCYSRPGACENEPGFGVLRSMDGGLTWSKTGLTDSNVFDLKITDKLTAYAAVYPASLYSSQDGGQTWQILVQDMSSLAIANPSEGVDIGNSPILISVEVDPYNLEIIYAGFANGGLLISRDAGKTWTRSTSGLAPETSVIDIVADKAYPSLVYLATTDSGVFYSLDGGDTWTSLNNGLVTRAVVDLALSADGSILYLAANGAGVWRLGGSGQ